MSIATSFIPPRNIFNVAGMKVRASLRVRLLFHTRKHIANAHCWRYCRWLRRAARLIVFEEGAYEILIKSALNCRHSLNAVAL